WDVHHREAPAAGDLSCEGCMGALDLHGGLIRTQSVTETTVDRRLRGIEGCQRLTSLVHVIELAPHHRRQQPAPAMGGEDANPGDTAAGQRASWQGHLVGKDARGGDHLLALEKRQGPFELRRFPRDRQLLVGGCSRTKGAPAWRPTGALLLLQDRPELEALRRAYRWTSARVRKGLPDPLTSFSGATTRTAPV